MCAHVYNSARSKFSKQQLLNIDIISLHVFTSSTHNVAQYEEHNVRNLT